jgi:uncharacterized protein (TIGR02145 family)
VVSRPSVPINEATEIRIGSQVWMMRNLNVDHYRNGDPIPEETDEYNWRHLTTGAWCRYNNGSGNATYGRLYNWYAVNDSRGLAPVGWHVPSYTEWTSLSNFLGGTAGSKMKVVGTTYWLWPNTDANNLSNFTGVGAGYRNLGGGNFGGIGIDAYFWSSTASNANEAWARVLSKDNNYLATGGGYKTSGYSVRCVKD